MMKTKAIRYCSVLFAVILMLGVFTACSGKNGETGSTQASVETSNTPSKTNKHPAGSETVRFGFSSMFYSSSDDFCIEILRWDENGQVACVTDANISGMMDQMQLEHVYDENGVLLKSKFEIDGLSPHSSWKNYHYDAKNKLTHIVYTIPEFATYGILTQETFSYHAQTGALEKSFIYEGNELMCQRAYDANGTVAEETITDEAILTYEYNGFGNVSAVYEYGFEDTAHTQLLATRVFEYDENERLTKYQKLDSAGSVSIEYTYTYDANGNRVLVTEGTDRKTEFAYDEHGNLIRNISYYYAEEQWKVSTHQNHEMKYNKNGQMVEQTVQFDVPPVDLFRYTYNETGSLIKQEGIWTSRDNMVSTVQTFEYADDGSLQKETYYGIARLEWPEQTRVIEYKYTNGMIAELIQTKTDKDGNVTEYLDYRFDYTFENGLYGIEVSVFDANGNPTA